MLEVYSSFVHFALLSRFVLTLVLRIITLLEVSYEFEFLRLSPAVLGLLGSIFMVPCLYFNHGAL